MRACDQSTEDHNPEQTALYQNLIGEEYDELLLAIVTCNEVEAFDATLDLIVVLVGYGLSRGWPMLAGWNEVISSNLAKIDPATGKVRKREDGKVLKPEGWKAPDLAAVLKRHAERRIILKGMVGR